MKTVATILLSVFIIFASSLAIACDSCNSCDTCGWDDQYGYENHRSCECQCVDPGWKYNHCMSKSEYCNVFGNIGAD